MSSSCLLISAISRGTTRRSPTPAGPCAGAELSRNLPSKPGREDYVRIRLEERDGRPPLAHPVLGKSGLLRTIVQAHGLARIPAESEGFYENDLIDIWII